MNDLYEIDPQLAAVRDVRTSRNLLDPSDPNPLKIELRGNKPEELVLAVENGPEGMIELSISSDEPWVSPEMENLCLLGSESREIKMSIAAEGEEELANVLFCWEGLDGPLSQSIIILRTLPATASPRAKHRGAKQDVTGTSFRLPKEERVQAAKKLCELIDGAGAPRGFFSRGDEKNIFRHGGESGLSLTEIETLLNRRCCAKKWTRETRLTEKLAAMMGDSVEKKKALHKDAYEEAVSFAERRGMPKDQAQEVCITVILDHRWPVNESMLDKWMSTQRRQYGI